MFLLLVSGPEKKRAYIGFRASSQSLATIGQEVVGRPAPESGLVLI